MRIKMTSPLLTRLLLIGCVILFHPKPTLSRLVPLYVWRRPPTSSPTGAPSFQPSLRPSSQPSFQPSLPPVYISSSYLTSEKSSSFGPWKTIAVIGFALCCLGVCFQLVREPYLTEEEDAQDSKQAKKKRAQKKQQKQRASSPEDEEDGWSNWLSLFWMGDDASAAPSRVDEHSFGDESSVTDASFFSYSTNDWSNGKSYDRSNATYDTSSMTYDTCSRTYDTSIMTNDRSSMMSDRNFDKNNAKPNKALAKGREVVSKGREAGQLVRQRTEKLGNTVKGKIGSVFKKKEPEKKDDIDIIANVSSFIDTALDQLGDLAIGEEQPLPPPVKKRSSKKSTRSPAQVSKSTQLPAIKENHDNDDSGLNQTKMKVANLKAMVEKKKLELKVKMKEKKWQNQQDKAAAAEAKRLEQEVKHATLLLEKLKLVDMATKEMMMAQMDTILQASSTEAVVYEDEIRRSQEREYRRHQRGRSSSNKASYPHQEKYHYDMRGERWDDYDIEMARKPKVLVVNHRHQDDDIELIKAPSLPDEICQDKPPMSYYNATQPQKRKGSRISVNQASGKEMNRDDGLRKGLRYQEKHYRRKEVERQDSRVGKGKGVSKLSNYRNHKEDSFDCNESYASRQSSVSASSKGFMSQEATKSTGSASTIEEIDDYSHFSEGSDKSAATITAPMKESTPLPAPATTPPPYEITTVDSYKHYMPKYGCF